jgi:hypothetical protein
VQQEQLSSKKKETPPKTLSEDNTPFPFLLFLGILHQR